jgi:hypothetical protein
MNSTRHNQSALVKSRIDQLEYRLKELETSVPDLRLAIYNLKSVLKKIEDTEAPLAPTYGSPHAPIEPRPPHLPASRPPVIRRPHPRDDKAPIIKMVQVRQRGRATRFTDEVLANIRQWVADGVTRKGIAARLGTTVGSLQVSCSRAGVSLWGRDRPRRRPVQIVHVTDDGVAA